MARQQRFQAATTMTIAALCSLTGLTLVSGMSAAEAQTTVTGRDWGPALPEDLRIVPSLTD